MDPRCRQSKDAPEKVQLITAGCKIQAGTVYLEHNNQVASIVYKNVCAEYGLVVPGSKWKHLQSLRVDKLPVIWF